MEVDGECGSLRFSGPVTQLKVAEKKKKEIRAFEFKYDDKVTKIGDMTGFRVERKTWDFTEDKPLVGVYGETSDRGIEKLGMIRLDLACQAAIDAAQVNDEGEEGKEMEVDVEVEVELEDEIDINWDVPVEPVEEETTD